MRMAHIKFSYQNVAYKQKEKQTDNGFYYPFVWPKIRESYFLLSVGYVKLHRFYLKKNRNIPQIRVKHLFLYSGSFSSFCVSFYLLLICKRAVLLFRVDQGW